MWTAFTSCYYAALAVTFSGSLILFSFSISKFPFHICPLLLLHTNIHLPLPTPSLPSPSPKVTFTLSAAASPLNSLCMDPQGRRAYACDSEGVVHEVHMIDGPRVRTPRGVYEIYCTLYTYMISFSIISYIHTIRILIRTYGFVDLLFYSNTREIPGRIRISFKPQSNLN